MPKHRARQHKTARSSDACRAPAPAKRQLPAIALAEFNPTVIDVVEFDFLDEPDEVMADNAAVTGFEDEDL